MERVSDCPSFKESSILTMERFPSAACLERDQNLKFYYPSSRSESMKKKHEDINILVVDDSPETVELIKRNLESIGYHIYSSNNVQSAIKLINSLNIDL